MIVEKSGPKQAALFYTLWPAQLVPIRIFSNFQYKILLKTNQLKLCNEDSDFVLPDRIDFPTTVRYMR